MLLDSAKVTSKGQVTIPRVIRERFGLHKGSRVLFEETPEGDLRVRPINDAGKLDLWGALQQAVSAQAEAEGLTEEELGRVVEKVREEMHQEARRAR